MKQEGCRKVFHGRQTDVSEWYSERTNRYSEQRQQEKCDCHGK